ncbi:CopG family transcriptional regulator [Streptomyces sp. BPTC-684]|uniref:CopG family transcriptional regulator n=1 Tax=Streptomyces sp. BPTC-684 TaxID=3043734 RepID=UPI0024B12BCB|nr:CopG family transcriptional regulator [Streptomyces sp. BPTC-684]WHM41103.1 CopG family transcriptional regulator [Streptomyces sp. BPTC-684]
MSMDHSHHDLDRRIDSVKRSLDYDVSSLESKVSGIESTLEDMEGLPGRVDSLEHELREAKSDTQEVRDDLEASIGETDTAVSRLTTRVAALERHLRQAKGAVVVDLDEDCGGELHALALTADKGRAARARLLSDYDRTRLKLHQSHLAQAREERGRHRATVLRAAKVLATTPAGDPHRKAAELDFTTSAPRAHQAHGRIASLVNAAAQADAKLAADDAARAKNAKVINAGERAETKLRLRLRSRLSDAVGGAHLLPVWFATAFGPMPPARNADEWMDAATDVLVYRATYQVTDPVVALGPEPEEYVGPRRRVWIEELTRELKRWG